MPYPACQIDTGYVTFFFAIDEFINIYLANKFSEFYLRFSHTYIIGLFHFNYKLVGFVK